MKTSLIASVCFFTACVDLDTKPSDFVTPDAFFKDETEVKYALAGVYNTFRDQIIYGGGNCLQSMWDTSDHLWTSFIAEPMSLNYVASDSRVQNLWKALYLGVERANILLDRIDGATMNDSIRTVYKGEAKFLRAYFYFLLVQNWGGVPLKEKPTSSVSDIYYKRSSAEEVYDFVYREMVEAADMVRPVEVMNEAGSPSKSAVWGLLARVSMHMAGFPNNQRKSADQITQHWKDVLYWAEKVIDYPNFKHELNPSFEDVFITMIQDRYDLRESIWECEWYCKGSGDYYADEIGGSIGIANGIQQNVPALGAAGGSYRPLPFLWLLFEYNDNYKDVRRNWSISDFKYQTNGVLNNGPDKVSFGEVYDSTRNHVFYTERSIGKWRREYELTPSDQKMNSRTGINHPILRFSDILLMAAEAENEINGPTPKAYDYLNRVRSRAQASPRYNLAGKEAFRLAIEEERTLELCFEGFRRTDLIRWGKFVETLQEVVYKVNAGPQGYTPVNGNPPLPTTLTGAWDSRCATTGRNVSSKHIYFPIPVREMSLNNQLEQNQGW